jgi:ribulose-phosphate 3-epimerase
MAVVCPSVTAQTADEYRNQIEAVGHFAHRLHLDLSDGRFAPHKLIDPKDAWWPVGIQADFHLMYKRPDLVINNILEHQPNLIIVHAEADGNFDAFMETCHRSGVKCGIALLPRTSVEVILPIIDKIDHVLIFSGDLGKFGGHANLDLLRKASILKHHKPSIEIGWDGGINQHNISQLAFGGVDVFNVGGFIQKADNPEHSYKILARIADETGTT